MRLPAYILASMAGSFLFESDLDGEYT